MINPIIEKMNALQFRKTKVLEKIANQARSLIPVLNDHNLVNTAKPLKEVVFELDSIEQEIMELFSADPAGSITAVIEHLSKREGGSK